MARRRTRKDDVARELAQSGELCLAFANTAAPRRDARYRSSSPPAALAPPALADYRDLVTWGQRMGVLGTADAERLLRAAAERPEEAAAVFSHGMELRDSVVRIFTAVAAGRQPPPGDLSTLNRALADVPARRVVVGGDGFRWGWGGDETALERMLWPVVQSAAELLISDDRRRVRQCADKHCTRLFVDRRSGRRRWCDPNTCGSREKGRRLYKSGGRVRF